MTFHGHPRMPSKPNPLRKRLRWLKREQKFRAAREAERAAGHISNRSKKG